jgi:hypothetical protein
LPVLVPVVARNTAGAIRHSYLASEHFSSGWLPAASQ